MVRLKQQIGKIQTNLKQRPATKEEAINITRMMPREVMRL